MGNVWSFNFFFYNRKQKRILYFACRGKTHAAASSSGEESSECAYNSDAEVCTFSRLEYHLYARTQVCVTLLVTMPSGVCYLGIEFRSGALRASGVSKSLVATFMRAGALLELQADLYPTENGTTQYGGIIGTMDL